MICNNHYFRLFYMDNTYKHHIVLHKWAGWSKMEPWFSKGCWYTQEVYNTSLHLKVCPINSVTMLM